MFRFEGYTLDIARHSLRAADREVALRPKNFELLRYLVENPDRLVTKDELLKAIWPNVVVTDESLIALRERGSPGDRSQQANHHSDRPPLPLPVPPARH